MQKKIEMRNNSSLETWTNNSVYEHDQLHPVSINRLLVSVLIIYNYTWHNDTTHYRSSEVSKMRTRQLFCILLLFFKAFDKVWHRGLLHKMKAYELTGKLIDWFSSYLKARRQKVVIKNNSSAYCEISAGVPQVLVLALS